MYIVLLTFSILSFLSEGPFCGCEAPGAPGPVFPGSVAGPGAMAPRTAGKPHEKLYRGPKLLAGPRLDVSQLGEGKGMSSNL